MMLDSSDKVKYSYRKDGRIIAAVGVGPQSCGVELNPAIQQFKFFFGRRGGLVGCSYGVRSAYASDPSGAYNRMIELARQYCPDQYSAIQPYMKEIALNLLMNV